MLSSVPRVSVSGILPGISELVAVVECLASLPYSRILVLLMKLVPFLLGLGAVHHLLTFFLLSQVPTAVADVVAAAVVAAVIVKEP